ncbi:MULTISPECIES: sensor histidine kinase KdpD [Coprobacillaceae]|uniref:sensor histidine kinase n=1 Tax=Coprobacillaceae TaxID=2810280 RepID=UPI000E4816E4|nr:MULTISPECIES: HAMP domain-containing sensor histidine kinase [Coprobacillaceae]RHM63096.1 sensor histidine kinase [Coprobacillus sp. AF33-1AC]RHS94820.1 sensor histidine kinase [Erysipelatoclostridium sp. AM42-17]
MKKKKWLIHSLMMILLVVASVITYLSYGTNTFNTNEKLNFDDDRDTITNILVKKSVLLDAQLQRRKGNYDLYHYYVNGDNVDSLKDQYNDNLQEVFNDSLLNMEDQDNYFSKGFCYYAYDMQDNKRCLTNTKSNLKDLFTNSKSKLLKKYQWYMVLTFNQDGNIQVDGNNKDGWGNKFYNTSFDELFKNDYLSDEDNQFLNQFHMKNPTNMKVVFAIPNKVSSNTFLAQNYLKGQSISQTLFTYVIIFVILIIIMMLFMPVKELLELEPFKTVVKAKLIFTFLIYLIVVAIWITMMTGVLQTTWQGDFAYIVRQKGLAGAGVLLEPLVNIGGWFVFYAMVMYFIFYIKMIIVGGVKSFIKEHTLAYSLYYHFKTKVYHLTDTQLEKGLTQNIKKMGLMSGCFIEGLFLFAGLVMDVFYRYSFSFRYYFWLTLILSIGSGIVVVIIAKKLSSKVLHDYQQLLDSTHQLSKGEFNNKIEQDLGLFNTLKDEFNCINDGFKDAVSKEVASQKMKTELISNVSHDLKTPLTSIISYVDLLKDDNLTQDQQKEYIQVLDHNAKRLKTLIEDLFEVSKVNSGNVKLDLVDLDFHALVQQVVFEYQDSFSKQQLQIKENYPDHKVICHLDSAKTYRVLENLCQNICKYALDHTRVYIDMVEDERYVKLTIKNISAREIHGDPQVLTDRFVQGDESRKMEGSGLGLAIVKSFVEVQDGSFKLSVDGDLFKTDITFLKK